MALMLGALIIHGITPGPQLMSEQPSLFWGLIVSFWIGNCILVVLNIPFIGLWVRLLMIPYHILYPSVLTFIAIGIFTIKGSPEDIWIALGLGIFGYCLRLLSFPLTPMLLGFVLGPMMEDHFRRAMLISRGDLAVFVTSPISGTVLALTAMLLIWGLYSTLIRKSTKAP